MSGAVTHHSQDQEFVIEQDGGSAELAYSTPEAGVIDFTHTYVDKPLRGQGLAEELAQAGLAYARAQQLRVRTSCPFMREFLDSHPEYEDLRAPASSEE
ncbi:GNAT family N-acetyltransferase [Hymenobacter pini]|uniref:GNAT family N-acetyltransferase n=1 Tax=Hymenobacter pini TaxID=2880879 RepID=UPI001CF5B290|nr:GNAT family N-acetyltransferase [Hymenobacter pini]MCA8829395.1 N-acetyltransferase [Hymenobacter pini]